MLQGFEKMISGMYLGDIVRRVLLRMSEEESDDFGPSSSKLAIPFVLRCNMFSLQILFPSSASYYPIVCFVLTHGRSIRIFSLFPWIFLCDVCNVVLISSTGNNGRTPLMAAMHEDDSLDLSEVAKILGEVLEVESLLSSYPTLQYCNLMIVAYDVCTSYFILFSVLLCFLLLGSWGSQLSVT